MFVRPSSNTGETTTTPKDRIPRSATGRPRPRRSARLLPIQSRSLQAHPILTYELAQKIRQATTTTLPDIFVALRSNSIDPDCTWKVPLTTSWVVLSFILTLLAPGLTTKV